MRDVDVVIVGAGAGGPVAARALAEAGASVLLLDAGPWLDPDRDYNQWENDMFSMVDGKLRWGPADRARDPWNRKRSGVSVIMQSAGVGGCTRHYNGMASRAHRQSFDQDWPFGYDDLVPYYEELERMLPVHRVTALAPKDAVFAAGCRAIGLSERFAQDITKPCWGHSHNAILPLQVVDPDIALRYPDVVGCTACGHCLIGCGLPAGAPTEHKAKRATDVSMVPAAVATGRCEVVSDAFATGIVTERVGTRLRAVGVRWRETRTGQLREASARHVVLAAGSIESPRLWLNSGLPDSGAVGRYLTTHFPDVVTGFFPEATHPDIGQATMAKADFPSEGVIWCEGFAPWGFAGALSGTGDGFWDETPSDGEPWDFSGRAWGQDALRRIADYRNAVCVAISTDDESVPDNRVALADDWPPDEHGPVPSVSYHPTDRSRQRQLELARKSAEVLRAAGATEIIRSGSARTAVAHAIGTMRLGDDPRRSVFDPRGEAHDVDGLHIADASALSNGVGGAPPSLTTQALALRTARLLLDRLAGGAR
ncbi:hypothetical protein ALI22I_00715 [Saccharothrix sp. ALI-22-I]|uniref:GMC family oxidoreductase N-terminal domain-containing protein n=1 Tax=Saccharothrix sp. ALI-22-I TaxID=1933778 RepID=UPI00097BA83A|nr:GMC family oxidoreductase N-terminal domain-containing protein [Saccharothrix sp. ALI-22-I]ONI92988.1 hypothetical protein ALI22I_00715 [Saccharothrix sp. ALI-22-I]